MKRGKREVSFTYILSLLFIDKLHLPLVFIEAWFGTGYLMLRVRIQKRYTGVRTYLLLFSCGLMPV